MYATRSEDDPARRVKNLILKVKRDQFDPGSGLPFVQVIVSRVRERLGAEFSSGFEDEPVLVPVPSSALTKPQTVWPALRLCEELLRAGLATDVLPLVRRTTAIHKSAGSTSRPSFTAHLDSFSVQARLRPPGRVIVVDDVVTSWTTMLACASKLAAAYPGVPVRGFALARVLSAGDPTTVFQPLVETILLDGARCKRG